MVYTVVPTVYTNDTWTAGNQNTYLKDNLAAVEAQGEGEETIWLNAAALIAQAGTDPGILQRIDYGTICHLGVPFDPDTDEFLNFMLGMAKRYDKASVHIKFAWGVYPYTAESVTSITRVTTTATVTQTAHGYATGDQILIAGADQTDYNGTFTITYVGVDSYTYTVGGTPATPATGTITAKKVGNGNILWSSAINAIDDGDGLGVNPSAGVANVSDAWQANDYIHKTSWVEVTPNGSPSDDNVILELQFGRDADNGSDTLKLDAYLFGIWIRWTTNVHMDD